MSKKQEIVQTYFEALAKGDIPTLFGLFSEKVVWHQPGENKFSGEKKGVDAIGQMIGGMMESSQGTLKVEKAGNVMENNNLVLTPIQFSAGKNGLNIKMSGNDVFRIEGDKIEEVWLFSQNQTEEDNFWGN